MKIYPLPRYPRVETIFFLKSLVMMGPFSATTTTRMQMMSKNIYSFYIPFFLNKVLTFINNLIYLISKLKFDEKAKLCLKLYEMLSISQYPNLLNSIHTSKPPAEIVELDVIAINKFTRGASEASGLV